MKKFAVIFTFIFCLISTPACFADEGKLYFIKNAKKEDVAKLVELGYQKDKSLFLRKLSPYLALSADGKDYALVILQSSSENLFYYFQSNKNNKIDKKIKKLLKKQDLVFEQSKNEMYIATFDKQAQKILTNSTSNYDFVEEKSQATPVLSTVKKSEKKVLKGYVGKVAAGSTFKAFLQDSIDTSKAQVGDTVSAILLENWYYNGSLVAGQGSIVSGTLSKARPATHGSRNGRVVIDFTEIRTFDGKLYHISAEKIDFTVTNEGKAAETVRKTATGAIMGALGGLLIGAMSGDICTATAVAIGAGIGAGGGLVASTAQKGVDAEIPSNTFLEITLAKPLSVVFKH